MLFLLAQRTTDAAYGLGIGSLIVGFLMLFVSIVWIIFPFMVNAKFNELLTVQRHATTEIQRLIAQVAALQQTHADTIKALQWMVDNWPEQRSGDPPSR